MHKLPPLTELRAFEAAARHLSFKTAATELHVTPTAISHQIKLLERYCGKTLFRRRPRPLKLTRRVNSYSSDRDGFRLSRMCWQPCGRARRADGYASLRPTRLRPDGSCLGCRTGAQRIRV